MKRFGIGVVLTAALLALAGCDDPMMGGGYNSAPSQATYHDGTIVGVRTVYVPASESAKLGGAVAGGLAGALVGNQFGKGSGNALITGAGALGGAMIGGKAAQNSTAYNAEQWTVRLDSGSLIAITQNNSSLRVGQHVRIIQDGQGKRIIP